MAQELFLASTEFHVTSMHTLTPSVRLPRPEVGGGDSRGYKAIVVLFMVGGCDSYNVLVPHSNCGGTDLYEEYRSVRSNLALEKSDLDTIEVTSGTQPCSTFGVHHRLDELTRLYHAGDAAFIANVGPLVEPVTKQQYMGKTVQLPPSLFSHNTQQRNTYTVHAQDQSADGILGRIVDSLVVQVSGRQV